MHAGAETDTKRSNLALVAVAAGLVTPLLLVAVVPFGLVATVSPSFLLLHGAIELFSVTVSLSIFGVEWHSSRQVGSQRGVLLGVAFLAIGLLDFVHGFSFLGMPEIVTPNSLEKSLEFRVAASFLTASVFLAGLAGSPEAMSRLFTKGVLRLVVLAAVGAVEYVVLFRPAGIPVVFAASDGSMRVGSLWESLIIGTFLVSLGVAWKQRRQTAGQAPVLPLSALVGCLLSEVALALERTPFDGYAVLGHLYKAASFYLVYRGVFAAAVDEPYQRLSDASARLSIEVAGHERAEAKLRALNANLEERTAELAHDIADRRKLELELKEAKSFNETIVLESPVGIAVHRADGRCILANEALARIVGGTRQELEAQDFNHIESWRRAGWVDEARETLESGRPFRKSMPFASTRGRSLWLEAEMLRVLINGAPHLLVLILDTTEAHLTAEATRQARDRLQLATDVAGIGVWTQSFVDGRLTWDERMFDIFGIPPSERGALSPRTWRDRCHPDDLARADADLRVGARSTEPFGGEYRILLPNGGRRHIQVAAFVERDSHGRPLEMVGISRDITLERELELGLRESKLVAEAANQAKGDFLANMSHEIRTPLNAVIGLTQLVLDTELSATQRRYLERIHGSSKTLLGILNDILDYSKIEAGRLDLEEVDFDLDELLHSTVELFSALAFEKELELVVEVAPDAPVTLNGDPLRVGQVLNNLVGNAVKFTDRGEVHVRVEAGSDGRGIQVSVRDTGIGMTEAQLGRAFQAFSQADTSTTRKFGGTGLGLTVSKRLVDLMKGTIWVESAEGRGSTFHVTLPLRTATALSGLHRPKELRGRRTLVVDDHETARRALEALLEAWSFEVTAVGSGREGLEALEVAASEGRPFELVLVDWRMPGMDGLDFAERVRALEGPGGHVSMIMLVSTFERERVLKAARAAGVVTALEKPLSRSRLLELLWSLEEGRVDQSQIEPSNRGPGLFERARALHGARVLVAEDNPTNQLVARGLLEKMGLVVEVASDGLEAIERVATEPFDAVLMDLQMPGVDGLEAARRIRASERGRKLPLIAMTAAAMKEDREASEAAGMNGHVDKPVDAEDLLSALMAWVPRRLAGRSRAGRQETPPPGSDELRDFDPEATLRRLDGDHSLLRRILASFEGEATGLVGDLKAAIDAGDWKGARAVAHRLKGTAGNAGAWALERQVVEVEWELKHRRNRGLWALEEKLRRAAQHCRRYLEQATPPPRESQASREAVEGALSALGVLLGRHRIVPLDVLEKAEAAVAWGASTESVEALARAVESFHYPEALAALERVREQTEVTRVDPVDPTSPS